MKTGAYLLGFFGMCTAFVGAMHLVERQFDWELHLDPRPPVGGRI